MSLLIVDRARECGVYSPTLSLNEMLKKIKVLERRMTEEHLFPPGLLLKYHHRGKDEYKRAVTFILDKTGEFVIVVHEKVYPLTNRKIGPPKGRKKRGENLENARLREVAEEIGLDLQTIPYTTLLHNKTIWMLRLEKWWYEVPLFMGREVCKIEWVRIEWLLSDIKIHPEKYNYILRKCVHYLLHSKNGDHSCWF